MTGKKTMNPGSAESDWLLWQLADSAFPIGGFAHSGGLEAARQQGEIESSEALTDWLAASLHQLAGGSFPIVRAVHSGERTFLEADAFCETVLLNHVANRGSRAQGQALMTAAVKTFDRPALAPIASAARKARSPMHFAPVFGAVTASLDIDFAKGAALFLFTSLRGWISSAIRLGIVGPMEGQRIQLTASEAARMLVERAAQSAMEMESCAQTHPILDLIHTNHDRLYSRLFVS